MIRARVGSWGKTISVKATYHPLEEKWVWFKEKCDKILGSPGTRLVLYDFGHAISFEYPGKDTKQTVRLEEDSWKIPDKELENIINELRRLR